MKKVIPYLLALILGYLIANLIFDYQNIKMTGFQLGVYKDVTLAKEYNKKYPSSILIKDDDVYRLYYSILSNDDAIDKMEDYLNKNKIAYYKKEIIVNDNGLIKALNKYEKSMINVSDDAFKAINEVIMESYGGEIWS